MGDGLHKEQTVRLPDRGLVGNPSNGRDAKKSKTITHGKGCWKFVLDKTWSCIMVSMANSCFQLVLFLPLFLMFVSLEASRFSSNSGNSKHSCIEIERKALVEFKKGLTDPSGLLSSWVGNDCCTWMGVGYSNQTGNVVALKILKPW
ncbi:hypothetical protein ACSBR2_041660 [Camellia fascicularis]